MRRFYKGLLALLLPLTAAAQDAPQPLSLQQAIDYALRNKADLKNARIDVALQQAKNSEVTGQALPQLNGKDEFTYYPRPIVSFLPAQILDRNAPAGLFIPITFSPTYQNTLSASASQILFDGSVLVALQARNSLIELAKLKAQASEEDVRYNVQKAYQALVVARRQYQILSQSLRVFRQSAYELEVSRQLGFVEKIEVDRTAVQVNNLATDSLRSSNAILLSEQLLKFSMGMPIETPIVLTDTALGTVIGNAETLSVDPVDYNTRTDYNLLLLQQRLNEYDLKRYEYSRLPSLSAFGTAAYTYGSNSFREVAKPSNYVFYALTGLQLNVPIFNGRQKHFQIKQAELTLEKTRNNIENLKLSIDLQTVQGRTVLRNNLLALQNQERNMELAATVLDLAQKKYKAGVGSNVEVTQAQSSYLQAQNNYLTALLDVINAGSDLQRSLGLFK